MKQPFAVLYMLLCQRLYFVCESDLASAREQSLTGNLGERLGRPECLDPDNTVNDKPGCHQTTMNLAVFSGPESYVEAERCTAAGR